MTAVSAFSARRRGSRKPGKYEPLRSLGIRSSTVPARRLPVAVAIAVALHQALNALLAVARARHGADLQLHQTLGRKTDHLAQQIGIRGLLHERAQVHHLVGHRWLLESGWCSQPEPTDESPKATAKLHHALGRDWPVSILSSAEHHPRQRMHAEETGSSMERQGVCFRLKVRWPFRRLTIRSVCRRD